MSNVSHTPGPWNVFYKSKYDEWHVSVPMSSGSMKWALFDDGIRSENPEADAHLIAAAPELLTSLGECLALVKLKYGNLFPDTNAVIARAEAAYAKATGAQS